MTRLSATNSDPSICASMKKDGTQLYAEAPGNLCVDWPGPVPDENNERDVADAITKAPHAFARITKNYPRKNAKSIFPSKSFADLLDPKWKGKIVKAHPGYSGTIMSEKELAGKVAIVTGAGRNIGRAIALNLAQAGASVVLNVRSNKAEADNVLREIESTGGKAAAVLGDIADEKTAAALADTALKKFGRIDFLINNAALRREKAITEMSYKDWREVIGVILDGTFHCVHACLPAMRKNGGTIINIGGMSAHIGSKDRAHGCGRCRRAGPFRYSTNLSLQSGSRVGRRHCCDSKRSDRETGQGESAALHGNCNIADAGAGKSRRRTQTRDHKTRPARNNDRVEHHGEESRRSQLRASLGDRGGSWRLRLHTSKQCCRRRPHEILLSEQSDRQPSRHHHWCRLSLFWRSSRPASAAHGGAGSRRWLCALSGGAMGTCWRPI